jgi:hypothetical protein
MSEVVNKDRPIIFSAPMVRALLDGRKTQTRRLLSSPLGRVRPGDRLWVRESYWHAPSGLGFDTNHINGTLVYSADGLGPDAEDRARAAGIRQRPSIHMPRWASRLTLRVTAARRERLQDICEADAIAEGVDCRDRAITARLAFAQLWNSLHGPGAWADDPDVIVLTFEVSVANIDAECAKGAARV